MKNHFAGLGRRDNSVRDTDQEFPCRRSALMSLALAGLAGCQTLPAPAVQRLNEAEGAYRANQFDRTEELCTAVIKAHGDKPDVAEAFYLRGLARLKGREQDGAIRDFETALNKTQRRELRGRAHAQLGNIDFERGRYQQAVVHYAWARDELPDQPPKDRVCLQHGIALQRLGRFRDAQPVLAETFKKFPQSSHAAEARRRHTWPHEFFTIQCGAFSDVARAHQHAARLQAQGVSAVAVPEGEGGSRLYHVRVGRYITYIQAEGALSGVRRGQPDAFILP